MQFIPKNEIIFWFWHVHFVSRDLYHFDVLPVPPPTKAATYQLLLSTASPKPGVSTTVSRKWTPPSFSDTFVCSTWKYP